MPRVNPNDLEDYLEDDEPKWVMRARKKQVLDSSPQKKNQVVKQPQENQEPQTEQ